MNWTPGYVRLDDRVAAPHPALRARPAFAIRDLARTMASCVEEQLRQTDLTSVEVALLLVAAQVEGLSQQALATRAGVDRNRASTALMRLEREGHVSRRSSASDARRILVAIITTGRAALAHALVAVERGEREALRALDVQQRARFEELLTQLVRDDTPEFFRRW
jgi:DNA-binding MarR family transcriptional regulator